MRFLRVVISCVSFETVKIVQPILDYKADRVHLLHSGREPPYIDFFDHVTSELDRMGIPWEEHNVFYSKFSDVMKKVREIIIREREQGNHVYVNVGAGPQIYSSAAMVASMMEGGTPFNAPTEEWTVKDVKKVFYEKGKPVGNARKVKAPVEIPVFEVNPPEENLVKGLTVWKDVTDRYRTRPTKEIMTALEEKGLMYDIWEDDRGRKYSQSALMRYRRNFLEKWESKGWIRNDGRGLYSITEQGGMILEIFS
ncbi:MAG: hypothetical protein JXA22_07720 [Candidatus Thermoplasmatota archaeon]|nr:hypothetical protein [Candidatus Thermoplasmatota archaeon]